MTVEEKPDNHNPFGEAMDQFWESIKSEVHYIPEMDHTPRRDFPLGERVPFPLHIPQDPNEASLYQQ